LKLAFSI